MAEQTTAESATISQVEAWLAAEGYEVTSDGEVLMVRDTESGIVIRGVLEANVLFLTVSCIVVSDEKITPSLMRAMLAADNGIATSNFQLYAKSDDNVAVTLNNFCKLQAMGEDDQDDVLSCVEFLIADVVDARNLLQDSLTA